MKSRVIEIKADQHHGLYIVQSGRALADMPEPDRAWAGPIPEPTDGLDATLSLCGLMSSPM